MHQVEHLHPHKQRQADAQRQQPGANDAPILPPSAGDDAHLGRQLRLRQTNQKQIHPGHKPVVKTVQTKAVVAEEFDHCHQCQDEVPQ